MKPNGVQGRMVGTGRGVWTYKFLREVPEGTRAGDRYGTYILYTYYKILYSFILMAPLGLRVLLILWDISERKEHQDSVNVQIR